MNKVNKTKSIRVEKQVKEKRVYIKQKDNPTTTKNPKHRKNMEERKKILGIFGGREPKYKTKKQLEKVIQKYFCYIYGYENIRILKDKYGYEYSEYIRVPSITGLALYLGFQSRQSLLDYDEKTEFSDTIKRAKLFIENYNEEALLKGRGYGPGIIFNLKNNFLWNERSVVENTGKGEEAKAKVYDELLDRIKDMDKDEVQQTIQELLRN